jgi:hypothetical protein
VAAIDWISGMGDHSAFFEHRIAGLDDNANLKGSD